MNEAELRKRILIPLLKAMGYRDVFEYHGGAGEQGKDIVCWKPDELGVRINLAIVAKASRLSGKASVGSGTAGEVHTQIQQCFGKSYQEPVRSEEQDVHRCWVVSNKAISKEAEDALKSSLQPGLLERSVRFIDGDRLWELIERYLPAEAVLQKLQEAGQVFEGLDTHWRVRAVTSGTGVRLGLEEKFPGASQERPFTLHAKFTFPDTEDGRTVREAFERHLATGAPVEIPTSFAEIAFPEFFQALLGDSAGLQLLQLGPLVGPDSMLVRIEILNDDGSSYRLDYVDLRVVQGGKEEVTLTNDHQSIPVRVKLVLGMMSGAANINIQSSLYGLNVKQIQEGVQLAKALSKTGTLRVTYLNTGLCVLEARMPPGNRQPPEPAFEAAMEDLVAIQTKVRRPINLPDRDLTDDEMQALDKLRRILHFGRLESLWDNFKMTTSPEDARAALAEAAGGEAHSLDVMTSELAVLFGVEMPLGRVHLHAAQAILVNEAEVMSQLEMAGDGTSQIELRFTSGDGDVMRADYLDWTQQTAELSEPAPSTMPGGD